MNEQLYNDFSIFASISTDSIYYNYLCTCFGNNNIYILNLSKSNLMKVFADNIKANKNDRIIIVPPTTKTFDINLINKLKDCWDDNSLMIFNNQSIIKPIKHNIIGFNRNKINISIFEKMTYNTIVQYLCNLYGSNIKKILVKNEVKPNPIVLPNSDNTNHKIPISIIIPAYNASNFLEECLDSIQNQTYFKNNTDFEILIGIDNCKSTYDKAISISHKYSNLTLYDIFENSGPYIIKNTLIDLCKYDKILFFDVDDVMCPNMIEKIINYDDDIIRFKFYNFRENIKSYHRSGFDFAHGVFLANKKVFNKSKGFLPWKCGADTEFHERVKNFYNIKYLQDYIFYRRLHNESLTNKKDTGKHSPIRKSYISNIKPVYTENDLNIDLIKASFNIVDSSNLHTPKTDIEKKFYYRYVKKSSVDYDTVIIIPSYNRFEKLNKILKQLNDQETKYTTKIIIYNDGSDDIEYKKLPEKYNIDYIESGKNNGKHFYWKTINILFQMASIYSSHAIIQIDDDFILCDNFIDSLMDKFFKSKEVSNKNVAINYHINTTRNKYWGYDDGIDGGVLFDTIFLQEIGFYIEPIDISRWDENPYLSSGVWFQITEKINKNNLKTYKINQSLAYHDGNDISRMNTDLREKNPLKTLNYKGKLYE